MKIAGIVALLASVMLYFAQIVFYTKDQELAVYGAFGMLWFAALGGNAFNSSSMASKLFLSGLAAFGLGFVPHRLRVGGAFDLYILLFPVIHFFATFAYLSTRQKAGGRGI
ncbi:hypothetical protein [Pseudoxanthomonas winnipegensis]|uniref:hypothetical protein n=1 Tax=Pseudoxanthomonas winnipegensis TaxID=2480810 RepID=UPI0030F48E61